MCRIEWIPHVRRAQDHSMTQQMDIERDILQKRALRVHDLKHTWTPGSMYVNPMHLSDRSRTPRPWLAVHAGLIVDLGHPRHFTESSTRLHNGIHFTPGWPWKSAV